MRNFRASQANGSPETVLMSLTGLVEATQADELMLVTPVYELAERLRSFELVRAAVGLAG